MVLLARLMLSIIFLILLASSSVFAQDVQDDFYVEASVNNANPYVGQQIIYKFKLYDAVGLTNPLYQPSDVEGFWRVDIGVVSQTTERVNGLPYTVTTIATAFYATQAGEITIKPPSVVLPETVFRAKTTLTANPISLSVQPLPDGQPADFGGGVGQFNVSAFIDRQSVKLGESITMTLTVSGTGNIEQLSSPVVPANWRSTINVGNYSSELQNGIILGKRDYQIVFFPTASGKHELPPIMLNYFDPDAMTYRSVGTSPVEVEILGDFIATPEQFQFLSEPSLKLKPVKGLSVNDSNLTSGEYTLLFLLPLLAVFASLGWQWAKTKRQQQQIGLRRRQALLVAIQQINAVALSDARSGYEQISRIVQKYVSDKLSVNFSSSNRLDIMLTMTATNAPELVIEYMTQLIGEIQEGLFAPSTHIVSLLSRDRIAKLLTDIDRHWIET